MSQELTTFIENRTISSSPSSITFADCLQAAIQELSNLLGQKLLLTIDTITPSHPSDTTIGIGTLFECPFSIEVIPEESNLNPPKVGKNILGKYASWIRERLGFPSTEELEIKSKEKLQESIIQGVKHTVSDLRTAFNFRFGELLTVEDLYCNISISERDRLKSISSIQSNEESEIEEIVQQFLDVTYLLRATSLWGASWKKTMAEGIIRQMAESKDTNSKTYKIFDDIMILIAAAEEEATLDKIDHLLTQLDTDGVSWIHDERAIEEAIERRRTHIREKKRD